MDSEIDDHWFSEQYQHEPAGSPVDFISRDGATILEVQAKPHGMRGLYSGLMQLAVSLSQRPEARRGVLVMDGSRISKERIAKEWDQLRELFAPEISKRLSIIVICDGEYWKQQDNPSLNQLAEAILADEDLGFRKSSQLRKIEQVSKKAEIFKVLIVRWLMSKGPIGILSFIRKLDPALKETTRERFDASPALVVHPITRLEPDFTTKADGGLPIADPVETALDLIEMGLNVQANDLFAHFRTEVRFA